MREIIENIVADALKTCLDEGVLSAAEGTDAIEPSVERPRDESHGDWASSVAMKSAKVFHCAPRQIADALVPYIQRDERIASVEVAGPGFINMRLSDAALQQVFADVRTQGREYGHSNLGQGKKVQVEFVSSNPTGPMHVGHGRWAALGDSMANVLAATGWDVQREFLINDAGNQMDHFAHSVSVRYLQIVRLMAQGMTQQEAIDELVADTALEMEERKYATELGADSYGGAYVVDIAAEILATEGDVWASREESERDTYFKERAYTQVLNHVKEVLQEAGVEFDVWFSERTLHVPDENGKTAINRAIDELDAQGYIYEEDGAVWFRSTDFGDDKNRVLIKADGVATYFAADVAYHKDKFNRGFDRVIDLWGADHHGYVARMQAACAALGNAGKLDVVIGQLVNLLRDGKPVRLSKRAGTMVTFEELLEEVGRDATRYIMVSRSTDQQLDFDIEEARKQDSTNPVYYVQYAHARICSVLRKAAGDETVGLDVAGVDELATKLVPADADLSVLTEPAALDLARKLSQFPEVLESASRDLAPFRLTHYAHELASEFHQFYTRVHVLTDDPALTAARLYALEACRLVLEETLGLLGVSAPCKM